MQPSKAAVAASEEDAGVGDVATESHRVQVELQRRAHFATAIRTPLPLQLRPLKCAHW